MMIAAVASAAPVIDQSNAGAPAGSIGVLSSEPIGQEFTPGLPLLHSVDVFLADAFSQLDSVDITLSIKEGSLIGDIVGSLTVTGYSAAADGEQLNFSFSGSPLALVPGDLYVIELAASNVLARWSYTNGNAYSGGQGFITNTVVIPTLDFQFQTYGDTLATPEPGTAALFLFGVIGLALRQRIR
jgi:hypothetical protein